MKALTLWQPWASLVALGVKTIETRSWSTSYRGPVLIHAAAKPPPQLTVGAWHCDPRYRPMGAGGTYHEPRVWRSTTQPGDLFASHESHQLPLGAALAVAELTDVVPMVDRDLANQDHQQPARRELWLSGEPMALATWDHGWEVDESIEDQRPYGDFAPGRWAWLLADSSPVDPVPAKGRQGLWNPPPELVAQVLASVT